MSTEELPEGLQLARDACSILTQPDASNARSAIRNEHAQRVTLQHNAADLAQRVADLEAERDELRAWKNAQGGLLSREHAERLKQEVNTVACLTVKRERYAQAIRVKRSISELTAAPEAAR
jgi:hypothetical protein